MEEASRSHLEAEWCNIDAFYTYSEWETKRHEDWRRIVSQRLPELGKSIAVDSGLFTYLQSKAVFDRRTIETFKQEAGTYAQVSSIMHALNKQSFERFVSFCECLIATEQTRIVVDFLTPELEDKLHHRQQQQQQQQEPSLNVDVRQAASADDAASLQVLGIVDLRPAEQSDSHEDEASAASAVVDYDWKSVIRENFMQLTQHVDPDSGLLNQLQSCGVISHVSADVIKSKKGRVNRVGAILDHVTQFRPAADFVKLCECLVLTNQQHVVRQYLTPHHRAAAEDVSHPAPAISTRYSRQNVVDAWRTVIIQHRSAIIDVLDSSDDFVNRLVTYGVMNFATGELCREETDVVARSEFILDHMQRRASLDMAYLCQALDDTSQQHVVRQFLQKPPTGDETYAASNQPTNA